MLESKEDEIDNKQGVFEYILLLRNYSLLEFSYHHVSELLKALNVEILLRIREIL